MSLIEVGIPMERKKSSMARFLQALFFVIAEAVGNIQYVNCQLRETAGVLFEHIAGPAAPDRCKACAVSNIEHTA